MRIIALLAALSLTLLMGACYQEPVALATPPAATIPVTDLSSLRPATPTPDPTPELPDVPTHAPTEPPPASPQASLAAGPPTEDCINGWITPVPGSGEYEHALAVLSAQMGVEGPWSVADMRYFTGPELPFFEPQGEAVERWYVKAALVADPTFQGRWLIERRTELIEGISAVARHDSTGYMSPDWTGFVGEGEPVAYIGLPGMWAGIPYDFVTGEGDSGNPGLPEEASGCLAGT